MKEDGTMTDFFMGVGEDGEVCLCETLFTCVDEIAGKHYVFYTDRSADEDGCMRVYASSYDPEDKEPLLIPIEDEDEWENLNRILMDWMDNPDDP